MKKINITHKLIMPKTPKDKFFNVSRQVNCAIFAPLKSELSWPF